jgi:hypothetical protein
MKHVIRYYVVGTIVVLLLVLGGVPDVYGAEFGVRIGTQRLESNSESFRPKVGLFYSFQLGKNFNLQPEIYLSYYTYDYAGIVFAGTLISRKELRFYDNLRYLEIPVLLKYRIPLKGDLRPVVVAGGYAAFRLSQQVPADDALQLSTDWWAEYQGPLNRDYAGVEGGLVLGIGIEHGSGNTKLSFDVRFNIGLSTLAKIFSSFPTRNELGVYLLPYDYSQRNHSMSFMVGLSF